MIEKLCPCFECITNLFNEYFSDKSDRVRIPQGDHIPLDHQIKNVMSEEIQLKPSPQMLPIVRAQKEVESAPTLSSISQQHDLLNVVSEMRVTELGEITLNIPEYGTNYHLLKQKVHNASELLNIKNSVQLKINQNSLKQNTINHSKAQIWRNHDNSYIFEYEFPCTYEKYTQFMDRQILPEHKNKHIREYRVLDTIQSNLSLRYLCFQKIGMLESRSFTYLKYCQSSTTDAEGFWEVCISKESEQEVVKPVSSISTRTGKLFSVSYIKQEHRMEEGMTYVKIRTYISLDINVGIEKVWEKILIETRTYIEQLWEQLDNFVNQLQ